jgi:hypothetical protein
MSVATILELLLTGAALIYLLYALLRAEKL